MQSFVKGVYIALLDDCNQRCRWCLHKDKQNGHRIMDVKTARHMLEIGAQAGAYLVEFYGGEPTMHPSLPELTEYAKDLGYTAIGLFTNGSLLTRDLIKALRVNVYKVTINSAFPEIHNGIAGADTFVAARRSLDLLGEMGKEFRTVATVIGTANIETAIKSLEAMLDWNVMSIGINCAEPRVINGAVDGSDALHPAKYAKFIADAVEYLGTAPPIRYAFEAPLCLIDGQTLRQLQQAQKIYTGCAMSVNSGLVIESDESVIACQLCSVPLMKKFPDSVEELYAKWDECGEALQSLMVKRSGQCEKCSAWGSCRGGCPMMWEHFKLAEEVQAI